MQLSHALMERRTVHKYAPIPVPEADLLEAIQAGMMAPNHRLTYPWRFYLLEGDARETIGKLGLELKRKKAEKMGKVWDKDLCERVRGKFMDPGALVVVTQVHHEDPMTDREDYATIACAIQNMSLSLFAKGWGSKWSSGGITRHPEVYQLLGIDNPKVEEIVAFLWVGEAANKGAKTPQRPDINDVFRRVG